MKFAELTRKKVIIYGVASLLVILVLAYVVVSWLSWRHIYSTHNTLKRGYEDSQRALLSGGKMDIGTIEDEINRLDAFNQSCDVGVSMSWQSRIVLPLDNVQKSCRGELQRIKETKDYLSKIRDVIVIENQVADRITQLARSLSELDKNDIAGARDVWVALKHDLEVHRAQAYVSSVVSEVEAVIGAYEAVLEADRVHKRGDFDAAATKLDAAYEGFRSTAEKVGSQIDAQL